MMLFVLPGLARLLVEMALSSGSWLSNGLALSRGSPGSLNSSSPSFFLHVDQKGFCSELLEDFVSASNYSMVSSCSVHSGAICYWSGNNCRKYRFQSPIPDLLNLKSPRICYLTPPSTQEFLMHTELENQCCKGQGLWRQPELALNPDLSLPSC